MSAPTGFVPFPADRAAAYRAAGYWSGLPLDSVLDTAAQRWPDKVAVADADGAHTFADLRRLATRAAAGLAAHGVRPGDRILLQLPNSRRFAIALFALLRAGAIPVLCLPGHRLAELRHFAGVAGATGIVTADTAGGFDYRAQARALCAAAPAVALTVIDGAPGTAPTLTGLTECPDTPAGRATPDPAAPALLLTSGGTTGLPKLIARTHDDYRYNAVASAAACRLTAEDVYLVALPAAHNFPLACPGLLGAVAVGATTVFTADPSPDAVFELIAAHRVTVTALVPPLANLWAQACAWEPVTPDSLRLLQVGGAKLAAADARGIQSALPGTLQQVFGMAEGLLNFTGLDDPAELIATRQGRPLSADDELRVVDDAGAEVAVGCDGELLVRGPYTLNGYFNDDAANLVSFTADGFYRTGDQVRRFADGSLEVTGRVKDVIGRGGESIAAADLEEHLLAHPAVTAVAAVGLADPHLGERVCAAIVFAGPVRSVAELNRHLQQRGAATHTRCDEVVALPALPTTAFGKVDKNAIRRDLSAG